MFAPQAPLRAEFAPQAPLRADVRSASSAQGSGTRQLRRVPPSGRGRDQPPADGLGALGEVPQPAARGRRVDPGPVVDDVDQQLGARLDGHVTFAARPCRTALLTASRTTATACCADRGGHDGVDGTRDPHDGPHARARARLHRGVEQPAAHPAAVLAGRVQVEDRGTDLADGRVEILDGGGDALPHVRVGAPPQGALQAEAGGEQPLDDVVVQVTGDPVAVG